MTFIDFFSGIGGMRRGLELAGHKCVGFCEFDKYATASYTSMHLITEEQRAYLKSMPLKKRQKEILKDEYRNGEFYADDIKRLSATRLPRADIWGFGAPCQSFSVAGKRAGLDGESGLIREIFRLLDELGEEDSPQWLIYENVKGMFSSNRGWDYAKILSEMDTRGYDIEWQNINSKWFVPQNRERIFTIGHNRRFGRAKVLPIERTDGENHIHIVAHRDGYRRNLQTYGEDGITESIDTSQGGGREPHLAKPIIIDTAYKGHILEDESPSLTATDMYRPRQIGEPLFIDMDVFGNDSETARCLTTRYGNGVGNRRGESSGVAIPIENQETSEKGFYVELDSGIKAYAVWYEKRQCYIVIRKLTPKECFRLQGWTDDYFEKAKFINFDSQLYKQAGNGITVNVVEAIGKRLKEIECNH